MGVDPGAVDAEQPRQLGSVDQVTALKSAIFEDLDDSSSYRVDRLGVEPDAILGHVSVVKSAAPLHRTNCWNQRVRSVSAVDVGGWGSPGDSA